MKTLEQPRDYHHSKDVNLGKRMAFVAVLSIIVGGLLIRFFVNFGAT